MRIYCYLLFAIFMINCLDVSGVKNQHGSIPYYLKDYSAIYRESPQKAALAWFDQARMGMFVHWGVWGKYHAAWAMYNQRIPLEQYQKDAREVDASGFSGFGNCLIRHGK